MLLALSNASLDAGRFRLECNLDYLLVEMMMRLCHIIVVLLY